MKMQTKSRGWGQGGCDRRIEVYVKRLKSQGGQARSGTGPVGDGGSLVE